MSLLPMSAEQMEQVLSGLPENRQLLLFSRHLLRTLSNALWRQFSLPEWSDFLQERFRVFQEATRQQGIVVVQRGAGRATGRIVIEVVQPDMKFQLLTVEELLRALNGRVTLKLHPMLPVRCDGDEWLVVEDMHQEVVTFDQIYLEIEDTADEERLQQLHQRLPQHIDALHRVRLDMPALQEIRPRMSAQLEKMEVQAPEGTAAWQQLLDWLHEDNFSLFGYIECRHAGEQSQLVDESALGMLQDHQAWESAALRETLQAHLWRYRDAPAPFVMDRLRFLSPAQRFEPLMCLRLKFAEADGTTTESVLVGLLRKTSLQARNLETPLIREKILAIFEARRMRPHSYNYNEVIRAFSGMPKFELFRAPTEELLQLIDTLLFISDPSRIYCFRLGNGTSQGNVPTLHLLVVLPTQLYTPANVQRIVTFSKAQVPHQSSEFIQAFGEEKSRIHLYFELLSADWEPNLALLESELSALLKPWEERFREALVEQAQGTQGREVFERYLPLLPDQYRVRVSPTTAARDILQIERLDPSAGVHFDLKSFRTATSLNTPLSLLSVYSLRRIHLIEIMPILQNAGLYVVDQLATRIGTPDGEHNLGFLQTFRVTHSDGRRIDEETHRAGLTGLLTAVFERRTENDRLNALVLTAGLSWREVNVLQAYRNLYRQLGGNLSRNVLNQALLQHPAMSRLLFEAFHTRFSPESRFGDAAYRGQVLWPQVQQRFREGLQHVQEVNDDLVFRRLLNLIESTLRTNFYQHADGHHTLIALKLDSSRVEQMPVPVPYREIYVHDVNLEGTHLRFGPVARGGLRYSDRPEDFRTEVLGLVKTQQTKNVVIVPVGSKGGFVIKQLPASREEAQTEVRAQYQRFIQGLLDVTDNRDADGQVRHPAQTIRYDGNDPYLVVAADKGTATFSDLANSVSQRNAFWLGDAFASGGSNGYDHKRVGITARGAWECVKLHFREQGHDIQTERTTVIGIGDMSGDVFGNGMLLSRTLALRAAFNHLHIFLDPNPDPATSWEERQRLFALPRSTWKDYSADRISEGGGVFDRKAKEVRLSPAVKEMLQVERDVMTGEEVVQAVLRMPADLIWFGGIGTYVKAGNQSQLQVGDQANDAVRINAAELRARVVGEGANLGLTQQARIEFSREQGLLNTDAIDNSAGVNMSDYEVNLKILLQQLLREGLLSSVDERNQVLEQATDEVAELVLANNRGQHRLLSMDRLRSQRHFRWYRLLIQELTEQGMNARSEYIPESRALQQMEQRNEPMPRPVLAVLQAYVKMFAYEALVHSDLLAAPFADEEPNLLAQLYLDYLPASLRAKFPEEALQRHQLRKEIIFTVLTNRLVNQAGSAFFLRVQQGTGRSVPEIAQAYLICEASLDAVAFREKLLQAEVTESSRYEACIALEQTLEQLVEHLLQETGQRLSFPQIPVYRALLQELLQSSGEAPAEEAQRWQELGFAADMAAHLAKLPELRVAPEVIYLRQNSDLSVPQARQLILLVTSALEFEWLQQTLQSLEPNNEWELTQQELLEQTVGTRKVQLLLLAYREFAADTLSNLTPEVVLERLQSRLGAPLQTYLQTLRQLQQQTAVDLTMLTVAVQRLPSVG